MWYGYREQWKIAQDHLFTIETSLNEWNEYHYLLLLVTELPLFPSVLVSFHLGAFFYMQHAKFL